MKYSFKTICLLVCCIAVQTAHSLEVMYWVPAYKAGQDLGYINSIPGLAGTLTDVSLQWWLLSGDGSGIVPHLGDDMVNQYTTAYHAIDVKVFLCVYNCVTFWDWDWAMTAYNTNRTKFIDALINEVTRLNLDGVDLDFEGGTQVGGTPELQLQRYPHAEFLKELGDRLHEQGKELSVCSFHSPCWNAPNEAWWPLWVGIVDRVRIMGYEDIYEANNRDLLTEGTCWGDTSLKSPTAFFKYSYKSEYGLKCGFDSTIMSMGMPSMATDTWGGGNAQKHIQDVLNLPAPMGICLWDNELVGTWKDAGTWALLKQIHDIKRTHSNMTTKAGSIAPAKQKPSGISIKGNRIKLDVTRSGDYSVDLYDISGRQVMTTGNTFYQNGSHSVSLNHYGLARGIYIAKLNGTYDKAVSKIEIY